MNWKLRTMTRSTRFSTHVIISGLILAGIALLVGACACPEREVISCIGDADSKEVSIRAAIADLAKQIERCPQVEKYRICWDGPGDYGRHGKHAVLYERRDRRIGYEDDFLSGISGKDYFADQPAIRAVASKGGSLEDFVEYDQRNK